uniref:Ferritin n=1 Tax=Heterorhabditis bacteriophora TaxID=37862 RepID=A0A1I7W9I9_HETBA
MLLAPNFKFIPYFSGTTQINNIHHVLTILTPESECFHPPLARNVIPVCFCFADFVYSRSTIENLFYILSMFAAYFSQNVRLSENRRITVVNIELYASYVYLSMSFYFDRDDVALPNISKFSISNSRWFRKQSDEEREHAIHLMKFQNTRGGRVMLQAVNKPEKDEWGTALDAFKAALALEKFNNQSLLELHSLASTNNDAHMSDFLEEKYLNEQKLHTLLHVYTIIRINQIIEYQL